MSISQDSLTISSSDPRKKLFLPILALWGIVAVVLGTVIINELSAEDQTSRIYLLPWCLAAGAVIVTPTIILLYRRSFHTFHPLVFFAWSFFFPFFFLGGLMVTFGLAGSEMTFLVQDERTNLPLTMIYIILGFGGLSLGFSVPLARQFGGWIGNWLPEWDIPSNRVALSAIIILALGALSTILGFTVWSFGYQKAETIDIFYGLLFLLSLLLLEGSFLLWLYIFRCRKIGFWQIVLMVLLVSSGLVKSAFQANRAGLVGLFIIIACAFAFSGRKLTLKHYFGGALLAGIVLIVGTIYATTFRNIKGTQEQISFNEYARLLPMTFDKLSEQDPFSVASDGLIILVERLDTVSSLAVVVSNYQGLAPYEESWGISNNIYNDTIIFFIPRIVWPNKPIPIEPSKYGELYFNYADNSFAITPIGDLLRNFGPIGVPIGMFFLGVLIRVIYGILVENRLFSYWRLAIFYMLFTNISFEGTYSLIIPILFKVGVVSIFGILIIRLISGSLRKGRALVASS